MEIVVGRHTVIDDIPPPPVVLSTLIYCFQSIGSDEGEEWGVPSKISNNCIYSMYYFVSIIKISDGIFFVFTVSMYRLIMYVL